jgi:hypothetical protein
VSAEDRWMPPAKGPVKAGGKGREGPRNLSGKATARPPLDIDQYIRKLGGGGAHALGYRHVGMRESDADREVFEAPAPPPRPDKPFLAGKGAPECSSSVGLALFPDVIWDVNGYYRELGFSFPFRGITRKDLRVAAYRMGADTSVRLNFVLRQLLDHSVRHEYDCAPLGRPYMDGWIEEAMRLGAQREAGRRTMRDGSVTSSDEVLDEWGMVGLTDEEHADLERKKEEERKRQIMLGKTWRWSYYLWRSSEYDPQRLGEWQSLLVSEFARRGVRFKFSVGYFGDQPQSWVFVVVGRRFAILLNEGQAATAELAATAVATVLKEHTTDTDK